MGPLKYGTLALVSLHTASPSQSCRNSPASTTSAGGPSSLPYDPPPLPPPRPPPNPPRPRNPLPRGGRMATRAVAAHLLRRSLRSQPKSMRQTIGSPSSFRKENETGLFGRLERVYQDEKVGATGSSQWEKILPPEGEGSTRRRNWKDQIHPTWEVKGTRKVQCVGMEHPLRPLLLLKNGR